MKEQWKQVKGYEGLYEVSKFRRVRSLPRLRSNGTGKYMTKEIILNPNSKKGKYLNVGLSNGISQKSRRIHSLVAEAFLNHKPSRKMVVDHIDNNQFNNRLDNLQIIPQRLNTSKDKTGTSKYTGVHFCKRDKKYLSCIRVNGDKVYLGSFFCELAAAYAYNKKLKEITL